MTNFVPHDEYQGRLKRERKRVGEVEGVANVGVRGGFVFALGVAALFSFFFDYVTRGTLPNVLIDLWRGGENDGLLHLFLRRCLKLEKLAVRTVRGKSTCHPNGNAGGVAMRKKIERWQC